MKIIEFDEDGEGTGRRRARASEAVRTSGPDTRAPAGMKIVEFGADDPGGAREPAVGRIKIREFGDTPSAAPPPKRTEPPVSPPARIKIREFGKEEAPKGGRVVPSGTRLPGRMKIVESD